MENQTIRVTCTGSTVLDLSELNDLQGDLKDLTTENYEKLKNSIFQYGISFPIFYWEDETGKKFFLDGHQRRRTLLKMQEEGFIIPPLPADLIQAKDKIEAKKKLLLLNSKYGSMTQEGFDEFTADIPMEEIGDLLVLDDVMFGTQEAETHEDKQIAQGKDHTCPKCGFIFRDKPLDNN
jgi:hypothetical protein